MGTKANWLVKLGGFGIGIWFVVNYLMGSGKPVEYPRPQPAPVVIDGGVRR